MTTSSKPTDPVVIASYVLTGIMLWVVLYKGLLILECDAVGS